MAERDAILRPVHDACEALKKVAERIGKAERITPLAAELRHAVAAYIDKIFTLKLHDSPYTHSAADAEFARYQRADSTLLEWAYLFDDSEHEVPAVDSGEVEWESSHYLVPNIVPTDGQLSKLCANYPECARPATREDRKRLRRPGIRLVYDWRKVHILWLGSEKS